MSEIFSMIGEIEFTRILKLSGIVLVLVFGALLGTSFQWEMKQRLIILQDLQRGILRLHQEIEYLKYPLEEAMCHTGMLLQNPMRLFFTETGSTLGRLPGASFAKIWEEMEECYLKDTPLQREDRDLIDQFGMALSQMETESSRIFLLFEQRTEIELEKAEREYREKAQLYRRLGMMGGLFLVILFW